MQQSWWDEVPYSEDEKQPFTMEIEAATRFSHPCGFVRLKERHRVKARVSAVNSVDRHCRIRKVILKGN